MLICSGAKRGRNEISRERSPISSLIELLDQSTSLELGFVFSGCGCARSATRRFNVTLLEICKQNNHRRQHLPFCRACGEL